MKWCGEATDFRIMLSGYSCYMQSFLIRIVHIEQIGIQLAANWVYLELNTLKFISNELCNYTIIGLINSLKDIINIQFYPGWMNYFGWLPYPFVCLLSNLSAVEDDLCQDTLDDTM